MATDIDHVLLTRFNLPSTGAESFVRAKEGWLRHRVTLFERFCLPSVRAQTKEGFRWIIYFDPESPEWLKLRIQSHIEDGIYTPIYRRAVDNADLIADISRVTGRKGKCLMTSNLDNDDGLAINFVERLQAVEPCVDRKAVYLVQGLIKCGPRLYLRLDRHNAFCSVIENWTSPSTCWSDWHTLLGESMQVLELSDEPGWLQVVHGANVSNRVRGRLVSPSRYADLFPGLLEDVCIPTPTEMARDLFVTHPQRLARESARALVKGVAMRLLGKGGLDRAKTFWVSRRSCDSLRPDEATISER